jgi:ribonuclease T2
MTLHGLWPNYQSGRRVRTCNTGTQIQVESNTSDLYKSMNDFWPSFTKTNEDFWTHEYNKHGYCYTQKYNLNDYTDFFGFTMDLFNRHRFDQIMLKAFGQIEGLQEFDMIDLSNHISQVMPGLYFDLDCKRFDSKQYLQEIRFFFDLDLEPIQLRFPTDCRMNEPIYIDFQ